jgi:hypothetical protein
MKRRLNWYGVRGLATLGLMILCAGASRQARAVSAGMPYIVDISPVTVAPGGGSFTLTVNGANFVGASTVLWGTRTGNQHLVTTFVSGDQLTAIVPSSDISGAGVAVITVQNPSGAASNEVYFTATLPTTSLVFRLTSQSPSAGNHPNVPIFADFNSDGILDLAVSNNQAGAGEVSVFFGNGAGSFSAATNYTVATSCGASGQSPCDPEGMVVGDFNGDGIPDLAVANMGDSSVTVLLGAGNGTFTVLTPTSTGSQPYAIAAADFNQDGRLDLAIACQGPQGGPGFVDILIGAGDGTFMPAVQYGAIGQPEGLALGDFNADGFLDLAVSDFINNELWILNGSADGTFSSGTAYATSIGPASLVANDFNNDAQTDLAVTEYNAALPQPGQVSVLLNSNGTFPTHTEYPTGGGGYFLSSEDLNGDNVPDLAVANFSSNTFSSLFGNGDGTFQPYVNYMVDLNATSVFGLALADVDALGRYDVVTTNMPDNVIAVLLQTALLNPSPSSLTFPNTGVGVESAPMTVTLANTGSAQLIIRQISSTDHKDFPETNTCGTLPVTLWVGASCSVSVMFTPSAEGSLSGSISIVDNASDTAQLVPLSGVGLAAEASLVPGSLSFGNQFEGTSSTAQTATLTNNGNAALSISGIVVSNGYLETNNCGSSLGTAASCSITVTFKPSTLGAVNGTLTVTDNSNGGSSATQSVTLTGTGVGPTAAVAPGSLTFTSQLVSTPSAAQILTLSNSGTAALTIAGIAVGGSNGGDFAQTNTCGTSVNAGASCSITVTFKPTATGTRSGTVTVTDNANGVTGSTQAASLTGTGVAPVASVPSSLPAFPGQLVKTTSSAQTVTLSNTGTAALSIVSVAIGGANSTDFAETNNCGTSVAAGANCAISVTFTPAVTGTLSATLTVTDNSNGTANSAQTLALSGSGTAPLAGLSPATLPAFADQLVGTKSSAQTITLSNSGTAPLSVTSIALSGTNSADFAQTGTCGTSVAAGSNCTISVTFAPEAIGTRSGTLTVTDNSNAVAGSTQAVALTGTGTAPAVKLSASSLTFPSENVGTASPTQPVTITNSGTAPLTLTGITVSGNFGIGNLCGSSLAAGASCTVDVLFKPTAIGSSTGAVTVTDDASPSTQSVSLSGTGLGAQASLSAKSLTFAGEFAGATSAAQTVTLTNTGNAAMTVTSIASSGDFAGTNNCGSSVAANASCTISVTFAATAGGARTGALTLTDSSLGGNQSVALSGTGQDFSLTAASSSASVSPGQTASYTLTLTPQGGFDQAVSLSCAGLSSSAEASCTLSPSQVTPSGAATVTVTVTTTAASQLLPITLPRPGLPGGRGEWVLIALMGLAGMSWLKRRQPVRLRVAILAACMALMLAMAACGGGGSTSVTTSGGSPAGSYPLTVTGTATSGSTTLSQKVSLTMTVQ